MDNKRLLFLCDALGVGSGVIFQERHLSACILHEFITEECGEAYHLFVGIYPAEFCPNQFHPHGSYWDSNKKEEKRFSLTVM